jgi:hypothetical protein
MVHQYEMTYHSKLPRNIMFRLVRYSNIEQRRKKFDRDSLSYTTTKNEYLMAIVIFIFTDIYICEIQLYRYQK